ncbi:MAG: PD-(D/E)XK nuclease family protein, partial [Planctomycetota bacterium]|nr:PD-(D/E)XK nuclease family protein [Planctomycetota bacterium]
AAIGGLRSPALPLAEERLRRHETAEELRLLYVVLTRARRSVTLSTTRVPTNSSPWKRVLDGLGLDLKARPEDGTEFRGGLVYRTANDDDVELGATDRDVDEGDLIAAVQRRRKWRDRVRSSMRQDLEAPSRIDGVAPEPTIQSPTRFPLAVGATVHDYLRSHDLSSNELDLDRLTALADVVSADLPEVGTRQRLIDQSAELLTDFLDSDLFARLKAAKVLGRELPVLWTDATGRRWHGSIDIVFEDDEIVVGDFKTDRVEGGIEQLGGRYRAQLTGYATALERAWSLAKPPRAELLLLRAARALRVT